tara:strand:- start:94 stop:291 length:198 start_codon:yes stop_codon:yes gene_type:complete
MSEVIFISIGIVLIIEGVLYFFLANNINLIIRVLKEINSKRIKNISLILVFIGFCLIYFMIRPYI